VPRDEQRRGAAYGLLAYGVWGAFPLYFAALKPAGAWEILSHRILWTLLLCVLVLLVRRDLRWATQLWQRPRLGLGVTAAAGLIALNWVVYVYAVISGRTTDAALGYFLNPIVTVFLGVLVLRERLRPLQWVAVGIGAAAGLYLSVEAGSVPVVALTLAFSFGLYGLVRKVISVDALAGFASETLLLAPIGIAYLIWCELGTATGVMTNGSVGLYALLMFGGPLTAIPLVLFAFGARRIPYSTVGLLQYIGPTIQLVLAVFAFGEPFQGPRVAGFVLIWTALALYAADGVWRNRKLVR